PLPASSVSLYELGFGTVAGICAGIFVKKGAKMAAWFMGGIFVLLQYLRAQNFVRVDWKAVGSRFENLFYTTDATGSKKAPTVVSLWRWLVDFLTADFQPRASFLSGFVLGLRIG
ncbi:FUN14 family-domain-containing protein, partial [Panaeolus papilionaceus]